LDIVNDKIIVYELLAEYLKPIVKMCACWFF